MEGTQGVGPQADDEKVFSRKPMTDGDLPDGDDDLLRRLESVPEADRSPRQLEIPEWDPERWDGMA